MEETRGGAYIQTAVNLVSVCLSVMLRKYHCPEIPLHGQIRLKPSTNPSAFEVLWRYTQSSLYLLLLLLPGAELPS